jgi:hypothetical protein
MRYGVEIEAVNGSASALVQNIASNSALAGRVYVVYDGSLPDHGRELKPQYPLGAKEFGGWVSSTCSELKNAGFRASAQCGLHYHLDRASVPPKVLHDFVVALSAWSRAAADAVPGINPRFFGTNQRRLSHSLYARALTAYGIKNMAQASLSAYSRYIQNHYLAVSWSESWSTIEVRLPSGTVASTTILRTWWRLRLLMFACKKGMLADVLTALREDTVLTVDAINAIGLRVEEVVTELEQKMPFRRSAVKHKTRITVSAQKHIQEVTTSCA